MNYINEFTQFDPSKTPVYYSGPYWDDREVNAAVATLTSGKWVSSGENVHKFECRFSRKFNQKYSTMVNSGSSANLVMIGAIKKVLKWQDGDEIILSPVGFPTTIAPVVQHGLTPVFVDIEFETLNFDLNLIEEKITDRTRAIFISPVLGNPPNFDRLIEISNKYDIELIMDNCDSLGSKWRGKYLPEYTIASSCSFYPAHHISTGEGGMVSSDNEEIIAAARSLASWGRDCYCVGAANLLPNGTCGKRFSKWLNDYDDPVDHKYVFNNMGYNLKPLDLQGAIGLVQLEKYDEIHEKRRVSKNRLDKIFGEDPDAYDLYVPTELEHSEASWFGTPIICNHKLTKINLVKYLENNRVQTRNYFAGNILLHPGYSHLDDYKKYPNANEVLDRVFFVGASPHYNEKVFSYIQNLMACRHLYYPL